MPARSRPPAAPPSAGLDVVERGTHNFLDFPIAHFVQLAKEEFGVKRRGGIRAAVDVLRLCMAAVVLYISPCSASAWMVTHALGDISDVAVIGRI